MCLMGQWVESTLALVDGWLVDQWTLPFSVRTVMAYVFKRLEIMASALVLKAPVLFGFSALIPHDDDGIEVS